MNITNIEEDVLYKQGKGSYRINNLKQFERSLTIQKRINQSQDKQIIKIKEDQEKSFKQKFKRLGEETDNQETKIPVKFATVRELTRIQTLVDTEGSVGISDLAHTCGMDSKATESAVNYLIRNNLVKKRLEGRTIYIDKTDTK